MSMRVGWRAVGGLLLAVLLALAGTRWLGERQSADLGAQVAVLARKGDIVMLASQTCVYCAKARAWFNANQVPFDECLIETDVACAQAFRALNAPGTPMIVVRGRALVGFDPARIRQSLVSSRS
jgi:glutaredoxin